MRLNDFQVRDAAIPVDPQLMKRNAKATNDGVDWKATPIYETQAAHEQDPFRKVARQTPTQTSSNRSYGTDSTAVSYARDADTAYVQKFLPPGLLCSKAVSNLYSKAYDQQRDPETRGFWCGLIFYLMNQPKGSCIRDCRQATLSVLLSKTLAA